MNLYWYNVVLVPLLQTLTIALILLSLAAMSDTFIEWLDQWRL